MPLAMASSLTMANDWMCPPRCKCLNNKQQTNKQTNNNNNKQQEEWTPLRSPTELHGVVHGPGASGILNQLINGDIKGQDPDRIRINLSNKITENTMLNSETFHLNWSELEIQVLHIFIEWTLGD